MIADQQMPGVARLPGVRLDYAEHVPRGKADDAVALLHASELRPRPEAATASSDAFPATAVQAMSATRSRSEE